MTERIRPFSCGTQYLDWTEVNCCNCAKGRTAMAQEEWPPPCDLLLAISRASIGDGTVSQDVAERMGLLANRNRYCWECPEREPLPDVPVVPTIGKVIFMTNKEYEE